MERKEKISEVLQKLSEPWDRIGEPPPVFSVIEISRETGIYPGTVFRLIENGEVVINYNGKSRKASVRAPIKSPFKQAVNRAAYKSRSPGGGPVVRKRTRKKDLERVLGEITKERSRIIQSPFDEEEQKKVKREKEKERLAKRWLRKSISKVEKVDSGLIICQQQEELLKALGLWKTPKLKNKYSFRLSPDSLTLNGEQKKELEVINQAIFAPGGFIDGSLKMFEGSQNLIVREVLGPNIGFRNQIPVICRLDLVMGKGPDRQTSFKIVEIEGDKTHALGYVSITDFFRSQFQDREDTKGVVASLGETLLRQGRELQDPIVLLVGENEKFYLKELEIFAGFAQSEGINLTTKLASKVSVKELLDKNITLFNIPNSSPHLLKLYSEGEVNALIPPNRFLGNKGLLAIISNADQNPEIERELEKFYDASQLARLRKFIPDTVLIGPQNVEWIEEMIEKNPQNIVIKKVLASGMKGVALPSNPIRQRRFFQEAKDKPFTFIAQRNVDQETRKFNFVKSGKTSQLQQARMFMRVSLFASPLGLATIGVTARETSDVHGARDAIQIPITFNN